MNRDQLLKKVIESETSKGAHYFDLLFTEDQNVYAVAYAGMGESVARELDAQESGLVRDLIRTGDLIVDQERRRTFPVVYINPAAEIRPECRDGYVTGYAVSVPRN